MEGKGGSVSGTLKQTGFLDWCARKSALAVTGGHSPTLWARGGSEVGRRRAQGRGPWAQLERPLLFSPSPAFPRALGVNGVGSLAQPQTDNITL